MRVLTIQPRGGFMLRGVTHPVTRDLMLSSTWLKRNGQQVLVYNRCIENQPLKKLLTSFEPDAAVLFVAQSSSVKDAVTLSKQLKDAGVIVIWADLLSVMLEPLLVEQCCFDFLLRDEFCVSLQNLLCAVETGASVEAVSGIGFYKNGKYLKTPKQPLQDLSEIGAIDWSLIDVKKCFRNFPGCKKMLYLSASIGCVFSCAFCGARICYGKVRRQRPIGDVIEEIEYLVREHGLDGVDFSDELLLFNDEELEQLKSCRERLDNAFIWGGETRPQLLTKEKLQTMYDAGCRFLLFGLETGSERIRKMMNKEYDSTYAQQVVQWCAQIGISTYGSFILGFPDEDAQDLKQTIQFACSLDLDAWLFNYFVPIVSTPAYSMVKKNYGFELNDFYAYEKMVVPDYYAYNFSRVSEKELATVKAYFDWRTITNKKKTASQEKAGAQMFKKVWDMVVQYLKTNPQECLQGFRHIFVRGWKVLQLFVHPIIATEYGLRNK